VYSYEVLSTHAPPHQIHTLPLHDALPISLGDSYQQGGISRATYRERRRRLLASLRERLDVTERNPLHVEQAAPERGNLGRGAHNANDGPVAGRRWRGPLLAAVAAAVAVLVAIVASRWIWT